MIQASFYLNYHLKNQIFNLDNGCVNRDNCAYSFYLLRQYFLSLNIDLSTQDINPISESSIVLYNDMPSVLPKKEDINKSYLIIFESEIIKPENWDLYKHQYFKKIFTWDDRYIDNKKYFKINFSHLIHTDFSSGDISKKEMLCTLIAGNKKVDHPLELYSKRIEAINWFEKYHPTDFDFYGIGWNEYTHPNKYIRFLLKKSKLSVFFAPHYKTYKGVIESKNSVLKKYKFAICYENAKNIKGYITEKIFDCFFAGCVPIYWGADNIAEYIPENCFIDKRNFNSYEDLYNFIFNMPDDSYVEYLENIKSYLSSSLVTQFDATYFAKTITEQIRDDVQ